MAIFDALRSFFSVPPAFHPFDGPSPRWEQVEESRVLSYEQIFNADLAHDHSHTMSTDANEARRNPFVWACQSLISGTIANLPMDALRRQGTIRVPLEPQPSWIDEPNPLNLNFTAISYKRQLALSLLQDGNAFVAVSPNVFDPQQLLVLNPVQVQIREGDRAPEYVVTASDGRRTLDVLTTMNCLHIPFILPPGYNRGLNPVEAQALSIGIDLASQKQASNFVGGGGLVTGVIEVPAEAGPLDQEQADRLLESFKRRRGGPKGYSIGVLSGGASFKPISQTQQQSDYIASRKLSREEIAGIYLVPPFMIGSQEPGGVAYASAVERAQHFIDYCLIHYTGPLELGHRRLVPGADTYIKFNYGALLRGDFKTRTEIYHALLGDKVVKVDEVREKEDWAPFGEDAGGGFLETPNNNGPRDANTPAEANRNIHVHVPAVTLPESVSIPAPIVHVQPAMPVIEAPKPDLEPVADAVREIQAMLEQPVVRTIERDREGRPIRAIEKRG